MPDTARTRFTSVVVLAVVFVSGLVVGMAVDRRPDPSGSVSDSGTVASSETEGRRAGEDGDPRDERSRRERSYLFEQVGLDDDQRQRIDSIVGHYRDEVSRAGREMRRDWDRRYRDMVMATRASIKAVMNAEQAARYDSLLEASDQRRREWEERHRRGRDEGRER